MKAQNSSENKISFGIDQINKCVGLLFSWLLYLMAFVTFGVVVLRYGFNMGWVWLQDFVLYLHASIFILCIPYTLLNNAHVRVDVFYAKLSKKRKALVNGLGVAFLLWPSCILIIYKAWPYVTESWRVWEGSRDAEGLNGVFLLKTLIPLAMTLLFLQGISLLIANIKTWRSS